MFVFLATTYLERSNSAKLTFKRAVEIFPIEVSPLVVYWSSTRNVQLAIPVLKYLHE